MSVRQATEWSVIFVHLTAEQIAATVISEDLGAVMVVIVSARYESPIVTIVSILVIVLKVQQILSPIHSVFMNTFIMNFIFVNAC